jgi:hypothetical protein
MPHEKSLLALIDPSVHTHAMFYPMNVPGLARRGQIGAFAGDPTLPYSTGWLERLVRFVRGTVVRHETLQRGETRRASPSVRSSC